VHDRADEYGRCTRALQEDRTRPDSEGIFDQALTNALAAVVAQRWPTKEMEIGPSGRAVQVTVKMTTGLLPAGRKSQEPR
jgi:hypothetical protein